MLKTVYDAAGVAHAVEGVDAREYIASGTYFAEPPQAVVEPAAVVAVDPPAVDTSAVVEPAALAAKPKGKG